MERFSDRIGVTQPKRQLQLEEMDDDLRVSLWNFSYWLLDVPSGSEELAKRNWQELAEAGLWDEFFHFRINEIPTDVLEEVQHWFFNRASWYEVYNFLQYVLDAAGRVFPWFAGLRTGAEHRLNRYLEREMSGVRCVKGQLVPVTSLAEIDEIQRASTPRTGFEGVAAHINNAMELLSKKPDPDVLNSIKESISAVEAAVKLLTGETSGGIDTALAVLEKKKRLHPAFKLGVSKLYAYTSDEDGIRHAQLDATNTSFAEAKFMLVTCSAIANLFIENAG